MQASGAVLLSRYRFIRERGDEAFERVRAAVSAAARAALDQGFIETDWYDVDLLIEISEVTDRVLGAGDYALCYEMGVHSCEQNLTGVYRAVFKFGNLGFIVERASKAWRQQYDAGEMKVVERSKDRLVIELRNHPRPHRALFAAIRGWMVKAAELTGEEILEVTETYPEEDGVSCRWVATLL